MSTIEFFRTEDQRPLDADGYELPEWENPFFAIPPSNDVAAALHEIRMIAQYVGNDDCVPCCDLLEWAADVLEGAIRPTEADEAWLAAQNADDDIDQERLAIKREYEERRLDDAGFLAWCDEQSRIDEMAEDARWLEMLEAMHQGDDAGYLSDRDIITATGGCG
jgi:hypothetical protein